MATADPKNKAVPARKKFRPQPASSTLQPALQVAMPPQNEIALNAPAPSAKVPHPIVLRAFQFNIVPYLQSALNDYD